MTTNWRTSAVALTLALALSPGVNAADAPAREIRATRVDAAPKIDAELSEPEWLTAEAITGFTQREPDEGAPESQRTIVRLLYDSEALYVAAELFDSEKVTARLARRDDYIESDWFVVSLDPHHDHRSGASFAVNPAGVQSDASLSDDVSEDLDWDAVWSSAARVTGRGWVVEMRIPYSQLRFPARDEHTWGINFSRTISRNREEVRLVHTPKQESGYVSRFAHLVALRDIRPPRRLELLPHLVTRAEMTSGVAPRNPYRDSTEMNADAGLTAKYGVTSNLTLTGTINPDFGQVEADPAVVNLTEYEIFFPEKRPFFLEGADLFSIDSVAGADLFYSRRIGRRPRSPQGSFLYADSPRETDIIAAAKLTGKTSGGWTVALLDALTERERGFHTSGDGTSGSQVVEPMTNYFVAKLGKDFGLRNELSIAATSVVRGSEADTLGMHASAHSIAVGGTTYFGKRDYALEYDAVGSRVDGSAATIAATQRSAARYFQRPDSSTLVYDPTRTALTGWGAELSFAKLTGLWRYGASAGAASPELETNDLGAMGRVDVVNTNVYVSRFATDVTRRTRFRRIFANVFESRNFDGDVITRFVRTVANVTFANYWNAGGHAVYRAATLNDRLTRGGPVGRSPEAVSLFGFVSTDSRKRVALDMNASLSEDEWGGFSRFLALGSTFKPSYNVTANAGAYWSESRTAAQFLGAQPDPTATATFGTRHLFGGLEREETSLELRVDWALSPRLTVQMHVRPFVSAGVYDEIMELSAPRRDEFATYGREIGSIAYDASSRTYTIDPDAAGPAPPFALGNGDFNVASVQPSGVLRWEFRPGSTLYLAWNESRGASLQEQEFNFTRGISSVIDAEADDVFVMKVSYWLPL